MARNIQPSQSGLGGRVGPLIGAIFSVGFWLALAALLPPPLVAQFSPELAPWVPIACYALAVYSLVSGLRHLRGVLGRRRGGMPVKPQSATAQNPAIRNAAVQNAAGRSTANRNAARGNSGLAGTSRRPTVQRMR